MSPLRWSRLDRHTVVATRSTAPGHELARITDVSTPRERLFNLNVLQGAERHTYESVREAKAAVPELLALYAPRGGRSRRTGWSNLGGGIWMYGSSDCAAYVAGVKGDWTVEAHQGGVRVQRALGVASFDQAQNIGETFYAAMRRRPTAGGRNRRSARANLQLLRRLGHGGRR